MIKVLDLEKALPIQYFVKFVLVIFSLVSALNKGFGYKVDYFLLVFKLHT